MSEKYTCSVCGKTYDKPEGYDEVALVKMKERYGDIPEAQRAIVCDPCWEAAHPLVKAMDYKVNDEMLRMLQVIRQMQERGLKVVGLIGVQRTEDADIMELTWGTDDDAKIAALEKRLITCIQSPETLHGYGAVDEKEGVAWAEEPWHKIN